MVKQDWKNWRYFLNTQHLRATTRHRKGICERIHASPQTFATGWPLQILANLVSLPFGSILSHNDFQTDAGIAY